MSEHLFDGTKYHSNACMDFRDGGFVAKVMDENNNVLAVRDQTHGQVRTDFPVAQKNGDPKWYQEDPTDTNPITGASRLKENNLYRYDPTTDTKGEAIPKDSSEYKEANAALAVLRAKYTPLAIISSEVHAHFPKCEIK